MRQNKTGEDTQAYVIIHGETYSYLCKCDAPECVRPEYLYFKKRNQPERSSKKQVRKVVKEKLCRAA